MKSIVRVGFSCGTVPLQLVRQVRLNDASNRLIVSEPATLFRSPLSIMGNCSVSNVFRISFI